MPHTQGRQSVESLESRMLFAAGTIDNGFGSIAGEDVLHLHDGRIITLQYTDDAKSVTIRHFSRLGVPETQNDVTIAPTRPYSTAVAFHVFAVDARDRLFVAVDGGIVCVLPNGKLDKTFGANGAIAAPLDGYGSLYVQPDGKLVASGSFKLITDDPNDFSSQAAMVRLTSAGKRDTTFGPKGIRKIAHEGGSEAIGRVQQDSQGRFVFAIGRSSTASEDFAHDETTLMRMNVDGTIDNTFAKRDGVTSFSTSTNFDTGRVSGRLMQGFELDVADRIIVGLSRDRDPTDEDDFGEARVLRLTTDGKLDVTFDDDGIADPGVDLDHVALDPQGRTLLTGSASNNGSSHGYLVRLRVDGSLDTSFGDNGRTTLDGSDLRTVNDLDIQPNSSILIGTHDDDANKIVNRYYPTAGPTVDLDVKNVRAATNSRLALDLTINDDDGVFTSTFDNRDLRITGPNGFVAYAKFDSTLSNTNGGRTYFTRYRITPPGGSWDASDNGTYTVTLVNRAIADVSAHGAEGRVLGGFIVRV